MEFIGRGAGTRSERNWIFFITEAKRRFQKIDQREVSAKARIKREGIFFITGAKWRFQKIDQKRSERKSANKEGRDIFYNRSEVEVSKNRPKKK